MRPLTSKEQRRFNDDYLDMIRSGVGCKVANYKHEKAMMNVQRAIDELVEWNTL